MSIAKKWASICERIWQVSFENGHYYQRMFAGFEMLHNSIEQIGFAFLVKNITKAKAFSFMRNEARKVAYLDNIILVKLTKEKICFFQR